MGLHVVSVDGMLIHEAKSYVLKCYSCFRWVCLLFVMLGFFLSKPSFSLSIWFNDALQETTVIREHVLYVVQPVSGQI